MKNRVYFKNSFFSFLTQFCHQSLLIGGGIVLFAGFSAQALEIDARNETMARPQIRTLTPAQELSGPPILYLPTAPLPDPSDNRVNRRKDIEDGDMPCCCCPKKCIIRKPWAIAGLVGIALAAGGFTILMCKLLIR
jgi:hypothetical protein